ncbi:hypothetical protein D3C80_1942990 [compost metagenome]
MLLARAIAVAAEEGVKACLPSQQIIACSTYQQVVAILADQGVVASITKQQIPAAGSTTAVECLIGRGAGDNVVAAAVAGDEAAPREDAVAPLQCVAKIALPCGKGDSFY